MSSQRTDGARVQRLCQALTKLYRPIRILTHLAWPAELRERFFRHGCRQLPEPDYPPFDPSTTLDGVRSVRRQLDSAAPIDPWFERQLQVIEQSALMLSHCGRAEFFHYSCQLYGAPTWPIPDGASTALALAEHCEQRFRDLDGLALGAPPPACHLADQVAETLREHCQRLFAEAAPEVLVVPELSANALAGPQRVRLRKSACFGDRDAAQLAEHEVGVHVLTSLNGLAQTQLPWLGMSHPGSTKTQEGLAVFAELITGTMDLQRLRRLADRVLAIQMAIEGADFIQVFEYFCSRTDSREQAFENTRRVFRGGRIQGGAPFTKDIVYLDGLLRVHTFMWAALSLKQPAALQRLFCGKLDIEDMGLLAEFEALGLLRAPQYLPAWAADLRFLLSYLISSSFLSGVDLSQITERYRGFLLPHAGLTLTGV